MISTSSGRHYTRLWFPQYLHFVLCGNTQGFLHFSQKLCAHYCLSMQLKPTEVRPHLIRILNLRAGALFYFFNQRIFGQAAEHSYRFTVENCYFHQNIKFVSCFAGTWRQLLVVDGRPTYLPTSKFPVAVLGRPNKIVPPLEWIGLSTFRENRIEEIHFRLYARVFVERVLQCPNRIYQKFVLLVSPLLKLLAM